MCYVNLPRLARRSSVYFFFNDTATPEIYTLSLHDALPISISHSVGSGDRGTRLLPSAVARRWGRSEEHTSELQSLRHLVCRLLLEKKKCRTSNTCVRQGDHQRTAVRPTRAQHRSNLRPIDR